MTDIDFDLPVEAPLHPWEEPHGWQRPPGNLEYRVTSPFGWRENPLYPQHSTQRTIFHGGLDIGNTRLGGAVRSIAAGKVIAQGFLLQPWSTAAPANSGWEGGNYGGLMVVIDHGQGFHSVYAHLARSLVSRGDRVRKGQRIGNIGESGSAKGAGHLHMGLRLNGTDIDPEPLILPTRLDTLQERVRRLRRRHPVEAESFASVLGQRFDGRTLTEFRRLKTELLYLREVNRD